VDRGVPAEFAQQQAAYDAWKENYLSRYPNAQQMPDGHMSNTPNLKPLNPGQRLKFSSQTESMQWASRVRVKTLPVDQLIEQKLTVMQWALNESTGRGMGSSVVLTPRAVRFVFENVGRYNRALCEYTGAPTKDFGHPTAYYAPKDALPAGKKSWFGKGLDAIGKGVDKVGKWAGNVGHNMITKVTADKLKSAWLKAGSPTDSDQVYGIMTQAGVAPQVLDTVYIHGFMHNRHNKRVSIRRKSIYVHSVETPRTPKGKPFEIPFFSFFCLKIFFGEYVSGTGSRDSGNLEGLSSPSGTAVSRQEDGRRSRLVDRESARLRVPSGK
jgi:hypothetical protein